MSASGSAEPAVGTDPGADRKRLIGMLSGAWVAQAGYVVAALGVAEHLVDGPRTATQLAEACDADPDALYRILRALASVGLFEQSDFEPTVEDTFALTPLSTLLRGDVPQSAKQTAIMLGEEVFQGFGELLHTAKTGTPGFNKAYGKPMYEYLGANPASARRFNEALGGLRDVPAVFWTLELDDVSHLVDVGGGNGNLLAEALVARPGLRGTLLELPDAIEQARERCTEAGVADRATLVEGSFFEQVPTGGDLYLLARCLHNWDHDKALDILRTVRAAMQPGGRLVVLEKVIPGGGGPSLAKVYDLLMLAMVEGRNRTEAEYYALLAEGGFKVLGTRTVAVSDHRAESAIEAVAI